MKLELILTIVGSAVFIAIMFGVKEGAAAAVAEFGAGPVGLCLIVFIVGGLIYDQRSRRKPTE